MLIGLSAILIPIIIEWLFRKRKRQVELPTIRYLLRNREQEKIRRQDRLLLLLRMFALLLLALALARPLIRHGLMGGVRQRNVLVFLDGTASMHQQSDVTTAFDWAKTKAATMVRELPKDTVVTVGYMSERTRTVVDGIAEGNEGAADTYTAAAQIEKLRAGSGSAPISDGIEWIERYLNGPKVRAKNARWEIYLFSDFQKRTWVNPQMPPPKLAQKLSTLANQHELTVVDVGGDPQYNYVMAELRPVEYAMSAKMPVRFTALVETRGKPPTEGKNSKITVMFLVNDEKKKAEERPASKQPQQFDFDFTFPGPGEYVVEAVVERDEHRIDNRRYYICKVPEAIGVLILDESFDPTADQATAESVFLARAIAPPHAPGVDKVSRFATRTIHPAAINYENLNTYAAVVLCDSAFLNDKVASKLERYVETGGALWIFMGERVTPFNYNKHLYKDGKGLLPRRLTSSATGTGSDGKPCCPRFARSNHPALSMVRESGVGPDDAPVFKYMALGKKTDADANTDVVLEMSNGEPLMIEKSFGRGRVLFTATTAGVKWTFLAARPEFPIMAQELLRYVVGNPDRSVNLDVGEPFVQPVYVSREHLLLRYPDGERVRVEPKERPGIKEAWQIRFDQTAQQGLYKIDASEEVLARRRFTVNQGPQEADLERLSRGDFREVFDVAGMQWIGPETPLADLVAKLHAVTEVAPHLLWSLIAVLVLESFLAARFGRRRGGATT